MSRPNQQNAEGFIKKDCTFPCAIRKTQKAKLPKGQTQKDDGHPQKNEKIADMHIFLCVYRQFFINKYYII